MNIDNSGGIAGRSVKDYGKAASDLQHGLGNLGSVAESAQSAFPEKNIALVASNKGDEPAPKAPKEPGVGGLFDFIG